MLPRDIAQLASVSSPRLRPDGLTVAFVVTRIDEPKNRYRSAIWIAAVDGATAPYQLTAGEHGDADPAWSPDGRHLAFTSRRAETGGSTGSDRRTSLHVMPVGGPGELRTIDERDEGIGELAWSPDGTRLAFSARQRAERYEPDDEAARPPRKIDRLLSRLDSIGWIIDRPMQVWVVPVDGSTAPVAVTQGPYEHSGPAWSPDSARIAFAGARHPDWDLTDAADVWVVDLPAAPLATDPVPEPVCLTGTDRAYRAASWSPSGDRIACLMSDDREGPRNSQVVVVDVATRATSVLTAGLDRNCAPSYAAREPVWEARRGGGDFVWFSMEERGDTHLCRIDAESAAVEPVLTGRRTITGFDLVGDSLVFTATDPTSLPELFVRDADGAERVLTTVSAAFHAACPPLAPERFAVASPGGGEIDAWLLRPSALPSAHGDGPVRLPVLVSVHGGPHTQYGDHWFDEFQLWASAGYAVVWCNPHGSTGRDEAWMRAILSPKSPVDPGTGWGGIDADDVLAVLDATLVANPDLDPERVGVLGGSYGGFMASWLVGHTQRFAAACSERACNNLLSLDGSSDVAGFFRQNFLVDPLDDPDEYVRMSPITYVRDISTPLLILHSEDDLRCPVEQADQLFVALRRLGKEVEYHRFAAESHELSRSGSPKHRIQRAALILDFFDRHLRPESAT